MKKWIYVSLLILSVALMCLLRGYDKRQRLEQEYWIGRAEEKKEVNDIESSEEEKSVSTSSETEEMAEDNSEENTEKNTEESADAEEEKDSENEVIQETIELLPLEVKEPGTIQFLFVGLNQELYDEILPVMNEYGYTGIIGVSDEQYLFPEGTINMVQFYEMIDNGWKTCLVCEDSSDFDTWYKSFKQEVASRSIKDDNMVYFPNKDYSVELNESIKENDIRVILHQGESEYPVITHEVPFRNWYIGSCRLQKGTLMDNLSQLFEEGGNITFSVVLDERFDADYNLQDFKEMMEYLTQYIETGALSLKDYKSVFRPDANW